MCAADDLKAAVDRALRGRAAPFETAGAFAVADALTTAAFEARVREAAVFEPVLPESLAGGFAGAFVPRPERAGGLVNRPMLTVPLTVTLTAS
jgi:hypothetical protein